MKESDICYETGSYWVTKTKGLYVCFKNMLTHAESQCAFMGDADGLSLAKAWCDYKAKQQA